MNLQQAYSGLTNADPALGRLVERYGTPDPFEFHDGGRTSGSNFAAMSLHILGQQISTKVAFVLYDRLTNATGDTPTAKSVLALGQDSIKAHGTSRSKAGYLINLAEHVESGALNIEKMDDLSDIDAVQALVRVKGIGIWTAEMFLIHQLHRPDIFPAGDVGLRNAIQRLRGTSEVPSIPGAQQIGLQWRPFRTYASALLWRSLTATADGA
ncbi:MAG: DNA-3-methyladenine glycosylase 2 family protein [Kineosporiaceae bacterium]|nr:DNA-3-methyladenine glycosylase 2 family protein [Aeromicrobium sp.]